MYYYYYYYSFIKKVGVRKAAELMTDELDLVEGSTRGKRQQNRLVDSIENTSGYLEFVYSLQYYIHMYSIIIKYIICCIILYTNYANYYNYL